MIKLLSKKLTLGEGSLIPLINTKILTIEKIKQSMHLCRILLLFLMFMTTSCKPDKTTWQVGFVHGKWFVAAHRESNGKTSKDVPNKWYIYTTEGLTVDVPQNVFNDRHFHDKILFRHYEPSSIGCCDRYFY